MRKVITLLELIISLFMLIILGIGIIYIFSTSLLTFSSMEKRSGISAVFKRAMEEMVRDLREAKEISSLNSNEIRFTKDQSNYYIYYFYNSSDTYPPEFNQNLYQIRKANLKGGINGSFIYSSGRVIILNVLPPPTSSFSIASSMVVLDLSVKDKDEIRRLRTQIKPRNL